MLSTATSFGRSGFQDWLLQRITAVILGLYTLFMLGFWLANLQDAELAWLELFNLSFIKYATFFALLALVCHAWIGMWIISTDYLKTSWFRLTVQVLVYITLVFYLIWGIQILWGQ